MTSDLKTKIVATIGPATWEDETLLEMMRNGFAIARINASFADFDELERVSGQLRRLSPRIAVMLDAMGHKIRVTGFKDEKILTTGEDVILISESVKPAKGEIQVTYEGLEKDLTRGAKILLDDGNLQLEVKDIKHHKVICEVKVGGVLKPRKTVNVPGTHLNFPDLSDKDKHDIKYAVDHDFDIIAASFVRNVEDIALIRKVMGDSDAKLIAKIEDQEGVDNFDQILDVVDGIMVARGDLGVELPAEQVPILQKSFIEKCKNRGKAVIVATQMLESMRENARPTRAEVSDVANAVYDGTDAVMLSAESSTGKYPVEAVKVMKKTAREVEQTLEPKPVYGYTSASKSTDVVCRNAISIADEVGAAGIVVITKTGRTVGSVARHLPTLPVWGLSMNPKVVRQMNLYRGVHGHIFRHIQNDRDQLIQEAVNTIYGSGHLEITDKVVVISGSSVLGKNTNSILEVVNVKDVLEEI